MFAASDGPGPGGGQMYLCGCAPVHLSGVLQCYSRWRPNYWTLIRTTKLLPRLGFRVTRATSCYSIEIHDGSSPAQPAPGIWNMRTGPKYLITIKYICQFTFRAVSLLPGLSIQLRFCKSCLKYTLHSHILCSKHFFNKLFLDQLQVDCGETERETPCHDGRPARADNNYNTEIETIETSRYLIL